MPDKRIENRKKLQLLLRELFQFDHADLDFGIYRIMNEKRDEVERFIEHDLLDVVDEALVRFEQADREHLTQIVEERRHAVTSALGSDVIGASGQPVKYRDAPVVQRYVEALSALKRGEVTAETEARIFNDLYRFFSRYYDEGDFLTERRYSSRGAKYCVPYNGEEVMLHWANRDQYYVKTSERFTDYRFTAGDSTVGFSLRSADVPQNNVKGDTRYFVLHEELPVTYDDETQTLTIPFAYRLLTGDEEERYVTIHNRLKSDDKSQLKREYICEALEDHVLGVIEREALKAELASTRAGTGQSFLYYHLNRYTARHTMDYFVHKDLGGFLRRELDVFLKTEVMDLGDIVSDESVEMAQHVLTRMRVVRQIAHRIIDFLAQIEDFQKRLFEKRKFVVQTDYCVTLDRVPQELYSEILRNEAQLEEWRRLYRVDDWPEDLFWQGEFDAAFLEHHPYLMIDTALFDWDFKIWLLSAFDDLDGSVDGVLIHGENFQGLRLLKRKYQDQVSCVYIDPPYNSKSSEILYKNSYKHSSWLTMMENRIGEGLDLLSSEGTHIVAIDENEQERLAFLLRELLPEYQHTCVTVVHNPSGQQGDNFSYCHDYAYFSYPSEGQHIGKQTRGEEADVRSFRDVTGPSSLRESAANCFYPIVVEDGEIVGFGDVCDDDFHPGTANVVRDDGTIEVYPIDPQGVERKWRFARQTVESIEDQLRARYIERRDVWDIQRVKNVFNYKTVWSDSKYSATDHGTQVLNDILPDNAFTYPKSIYTLIDSIDAGLNNSAIGLVVDYFAGSGTTAHAVIDLNRENGGKRKYILMEMADYFDTVLKPRILKVVFSANWKDGVPQDRNGMTHMVKYHRIESYEDALDNIRVREPEGGQLELLRQFEDYMLHYMLDFETRDSSSLLAQEAFETPFEYTLKIQRGHESPEDTTVDLVETFHYLIGMHVRQLERYEHQNRTYVVSRGDVCAERGIDRVVTIWRDTEDLDLEQEADWVAAEVLTDVVDRVYVNGYETFIPKAEPIEITFRERMEAEVYGA
jgi:adenine-specific DNA-methyltransferase